jgi:transcriptional regulator with XRE-family HTH domain
MTKLYTANSKKSIIKFAVLICKFTEEISEYAVLFGKFAELIKNFTYRKAIFIMYRDKLEELRKEKGISNKKWSEESRVSLDTIGRIIHPENPEKDSPRVSTLEDLCKVLGVELWEIFYCGDRSFVDLQAEYNNLKAERDALLAENGALKAKVEALRDKVDNLNDVIITKLLH